MPLKARDREILVRVRVEFDQPIKLSHESVDRRPDHALRLGPNYKTTTSPPAVKTATRVPELRQLMISRVVEFVLVYSMDRLHRNTADVSEYMCAANLAPDACPDDANPEFLRARPGGALALDPDRQAIRMQIRCTQQPPAAGRYGAGTEVLGEHSAAKNMDHPCGGACHCSRGCHFYALCGRQGHRRCGLPD